MPFAARVGDTVTHPTPPTLTPGPGAPTVLIGNMPAWRAVPPAVGVALEAACTQMEQFLKEPPMSPFDAAPKLAEIEANMMAAASAAEAAVGNGATGPVAGAYATLAATDTTLTNSWTAATHVPVDREKAKKGADAADKAVIDPTVKAAADAAYTTGIKEAAKVAAMAAVAAIVALMDTHVCGICGPGAVTKGSATVVICNLAAARQTDQVFEACGGPDPIVMGCPTVDIGG